MTRLTDTQLLILSAAAQRGDRNLLPLPGSLRGTAAKVVGALLSRGLAEERATNSLAIADAALNRFWRNDGDGRAVLLEMSDAGLAAIAVEPLEAADGACDAPEHGSEGPGVGGAPDAAADGPAAPRARRREETKQARLIAMLRRKEGATIAQIIEAIGWRPHTVRGAFAGALKKRLGLTVTSEKVGGERVYRIA
jgi:hypothetical protein